MVSICIAYHQNLHRILTGFFVSSKCIKIVDLAAENGGNIETTVPGQVVTVHDVVHIGLTDLPSRLPTQSSTLYANNITKFLLSIGEKDHFHINLDDEVVRGSIILNQGVLLWPPPMISVSSRPAAPAQVAKAKATNANPENLPAVSPFNDTFKKSKYFYFLPLLDPATDFLYCVFQV